MTAMLDYARNVLESGGYDVNEVRELSTGFGYQLRCLGGEVVCAYRSGKVVPQGKNARAVTALFAAAAPPPKPQPVVKPKAVATAGGADNGEKFVSRYPPDWSDVWDGKVPF